MNKISMLFFGFGITLGLLLSPARRLFLNPWLWASAGIAFLIFLPHILWQIAYDFPTREFIHNATMYKNMPLSPLQFIWAQMLENNLLLVPFWLGGLIWLLYRGKEQPYQALGWMYLIVLLFLITQRGKPYYLAPAYSILFSAGAVAVEHGIQKFHRSGMQVGFQIAICLLLTISGILFAPFALPILSPENFLRYASALGIETLRRNVASRVYCPRFFADRHGWEEMVATVASVYQQPTPRNRNDVPSSRETMVRLEQSIILESITAPQRHLLP